MRILLVGEFSRLHNSLKEGLIELGHDVTIMGNKDGFKDYPVDIYINHSFQSKFLHKLKVGIYKLTGVNLPALEIFYKTKKKLNNLGHFDVIQLINEFTFQVTPKLEIKLINLLKEKCDKLFLLSCSYDYQNIKYAIDGGFKYSVMTPYLKNKALKNKFQFQLQFLNPKFIDLHNHLYSICNGVIATDMDYHFPLMNEKKYLGLIPNPININNIKFIPRGINGKIKIFHGINKLASLKKGNIFFTKALKIIKEKFEDNVEIITTENIPYKDYIKLYDECHILLDMVYAYDQGYNALEAMAKGKVVFTGAEQEWLDYYNIEEDTIVINALPDVEYLVKKIEWLILNPDKILEISKNARGFIEREHHFIEVSNKYLDFWNNN